MSFNKILDACLEQVHSGELTIEECLAEHSELRSELEPLLRASLQLNSLAQLTPNAEGKSRLRTKLIAFARENPPKSSRLGRLPRQRRFALSALALVLALFASGTALAQAALPGEPLYNWKLWSERVYITINSDSLEARIRLSNRRAAELLATSATQQVKESAFQNYLNSLENLSKEINANEDIFSDNLRLMQVRESLLTQQKQLEDVGLDVPVLDSLLNAVETPGESSNDNATEMPTKQPRDEDTHSEGSPEKRPTLVSVLPLDALES